MKKHSFVPSTIADVVRVATLLGAIGCAAVQRVSPPPSPAESRRAEFEYRRLHAAGGQFIAETELAREADAPLIDVLRRHFRGFTNLRDGRVVSDVDIPSQLDVYVNGLRSVGFDVRPRDLLGVEYYQASEAPVKYRRAFTAAPVLLLWLKP